jgi:hypothetical protein
VQHGLRITSLGCALELRHPYDRIERTKLTVDMTEARGALCHPIACERPYWRHPLVGFGTSLSNGVPTNITSISLTASDWDVFDCTNYQPAGSTNVVLVQTDSVQRRRCSRPRLPRAAPSDETKLRNSHFCLYVLPAASIKLAAQLAINQRAKV